MVDPTYISILYKEIGDPPLFFVDFYSGLTVDSALKP